MSSPRGGRPRDSPSPSSTSPPPPPPDMGTGRSECDRVLEWESGLPTAAELTPLSSPLIPRALAAAFRIGGVAGASDSPTSQLSLPWDDDDDDEEEEEDEEEDRDRDREMENAATGGGKLGKKKARMVWTAELHHRFIEAVAQLGDKAAVPKAIVQVMNVEGITREHVASHLQKYRLYLKRKRTTHAAPPRLRVMPPTHGFSFSSQQSTDASERSDYCEKV